MFKDVTLRQIKVIKVPPGCFVQSQSFSEVTSDIPELVSTCLVVVTVAKSRPGSQRGERGSLCVKLAADCNLKEV